eukprot:516140-Ditylum_brightwellii.AAC.3
MGAFMNVHSIWSAILSCLAWICLIYKAAYSFVGQTVKKPPDPTRSFRGGMVKWIIMIIISQSKINQSILPIDALQLQEDVRPDVSNLDPSLLSDESFLKFEMHQDLGCCVSIPGVNTQNIKQVACFSDHSEELMLDTGATRAVSFEKKDFVSYSKKNKGRILKGIAKGLNIKGIGVIQYQFQADEGSEIMLNIKACHVPEMPMRLISPQDLETIQGNPIKFSTFSLYQGRKGYSRMEVKPDHLNWEDMPPVQTKRMKLNPRNNLPWLLVRTPVSEEETVTSFQAAVDLAFEQNKNLDSAQKELLK